MIIITLEGLGSLQELLAINFITDYTVIYIISLRI